MSITTKRLDIQQGSKNIYHNEKSILLIYFGKVCARKCFKYQMLWWELWTWSPVTQDKAWHGGTPEWRSALCCHLVMRHSSSLGQTALMALKSDPQMVTLICVCSLHMKLDVSSFLRHSLNWPNWVSYNVFMAWSLCTGPEIYKQ